VKNRTVMLAAALLAGAAIWPSEPVAAQTAPQQLAAEKKAVCDGIAALVAPDDFVAQQSDKVVDATIVAMRRGDPTFDQLEAQYPGLLQALKTAWKPMVRKNSVEVLPLYRAELSQLYQDNLTLAEARQVMTFFSSPEFKAFITSARSNLDYANTAESIVTNEQLTGGAVRKDMLAAGERTVAQMTQAQQGKLTAFFATPTGRKLIGLRNRKLQIDLKWSNYVSPEMEKEMELVTIEAMLDHIAKTDPGTAAGMRQELVKSGDLPKS
jgi:hypothetical protein